VIVPTNTGRWVKFNIVGLAGFLIQLAVLAALAGQLGLHHLLATLVAVESAVVHNFVWHERWTWSDRSRRGRAWGRFFRFNAANGAISLAGNIVLMWVLVDKAQVHYIPANILSVAVCSILNFLAGDRAIFR
jgi:putative flippase GtrA